jgi:tetratricopeptide (TPR) repeat protein
VEQSRKRTEVWGLAAVVFLAVALGRLLRCFSPESLPQMPGDDVLALVLGDARQQVSLLLLDKVDEYFHGGVRGVDCPMGVEGAEHEHEHEHGHAKEGVAEPPAAAFDPWAWLDARVHVQEDRHLADEDSSELLPWVWAACRTSPNNIQAFQVGAYVLTRMAGRTEEGLRLLEEGVRKNPACAELEFSLGEMWLNRKHDPERAEACFISALAKVRPAEGAPGEEAKILKLRTLFYLGYLAKKRGDLERVRGFLREAEALHPEHVCTKDLRALLGAGETSK